MKVAPDNIDSNADEEEDNNEPGQCGRVDERAGLRLAV